MNSAHVNILVISLFSAKKRCAAKYFRFDSCFSLYFAQNLRFALFYSCFVRLLSLLSDAKKTFFAKAAKQKKDPDKRRVLVKQLKSRQKYLPGLCLLVLHLHGMISKMDVSF